MKNLEQTRREIDRIDEGLVKLFLERLAVSRDVAMAKLETGGPVSDPAREREILTRVSEAAGPENENAARLFFSTLFSISKARQRGILKGDSPLVREIKNTIATHANPFPSRAFVACCGTEGSYAQHTSTRSRRSSRRWRRGFAHMASFLSRIRRRALSRLSTT